MKPIFKTDIALLLLFILSLFTGVQIHYASHFQSHSVWHNWSVAHIVINVALLIMAIIHIKQHWGWFKTLFTTFNRKSKITVLLTFVFALEFITGIVLLLFVYSCNSFMGLFHYWVGIIFGVMALVHFIMRWKIFKTGVKR